MKACYRCARIPATATERPRTEDTAIRTLIGLLALLLPVPMLLFSWAPSPAAAAEPWPHSTIIGSRLGWVHPLVNYAVDPIWQRDWERRLLDGSSLQTTVGSVSTESFFTRMIVNLDRPLRGRFRFVYRGTWREGNHRDEDLQEHWLGLEARLAGPVGVHLQAHPTSDKAEMDLRAGLVLTDERRERYLRLSLRLDDFAYGAKNDLGGDSESESVGVQWEGRYTAGRWEMVSSGYYGSVSQRRYDDPELSPDLAAAVRDRGGSTWTVRYLLDDGDFLSVGADHDAFAAAECHRDADHSYAYDNESLHLRARWVLHARRTWGLRSEMHWLRQWSASSGRWNFRYRREDLFPALFGQWRPSASSTLELGYMACLHRWDYDTPWGPRPVNDYTDKVKLGWLYAFTPEARLQVSISHEVDLDRFGGGNIQYQMTF